MNVWSYWEGPKLLYMEACISSIRRACHDVDFHLLSPGTVKDFVPEGLLDQSYKQLGHVALRADCIRAALLYLHGGWWWDADTIALRSPTTLEHPEGKALYMTWSHPPVRVICGYVYLPKEHPLAKHWLDEVNRALRFGTPEERGHWFTFSEKIMKVAAGHPDAVEIPRKLFFPIEVDCEVERYFSPGDPDSLISPQTLAFGLNNSYFVYHHRDRMINPRAEWDKSPLLIHQLLNRYGGQPCL